MSIEIWPPISEEELAIKEAEVQMLIDPKTGYKKRELEWMINEVRDTLRVIKHGLEDCYALLAPIDPGSTLVMSTQRNERVKGHVTRVGTRIIKGTLQLQLRTLPQQTITIDPDHPIHISALDTVHKQLTECIDMLGIFLGMELNATFISAQLRVLATAVGECSALLKGPPLTESDALWTSASCAPSHFSPPLGPNISFFLGVQESSLVLWLRALEPVDAPVHFGMKLGLAIGTFRRLEHDEMDAVFDVSFPNSDALVRPGSSKGRAASQSKQSKSVPVYVREKVRVESADPNLMSVSSKLIALGHTILQLRRNLAAVMGEEFEEGD